MEPYITATAERMRRSVSLSADARSFDAKNDIAVASGCCRAASQASQDADLHAHLVVVERPLQLVLLAACGFEMELRFACNLPVVLYRSPVPPRTFPDHSSNENPRNTCSAMIFAPRPAFRSRKTAIFP
jgi:hypothetical protein